MLLGCASPEASAQVGRRVRVLLDLYTAKDRGAVTDQTTILNVWMRGGLVYMLSNDVGHSWSFPYHGSGLPHGREVVGMIRRLWPRMHVTYCQEKVAA